MRTFKHNSMKSIIAFLILTDITQNIIRPLHYQFAKLYFIPNIPYIGYFLEYSCCGRHLTKSHPAHTAIRKSFPSIPLYQCGLQA